MAAPDTSHPHGTQARPCPPGVEDFGFDLPPPGTSTVNTETIAADPLSREDFGFDFPLQTNVADPLGREDFRFDGPLKNRQGKSSCQRGLWV